ncbi:hypothetical protein F3D3_2460 [Fusibacter sp. 3D3]|nr:hypothetical protein F3D3_2460 [Fusibacter sp. 3D3]
MSTHHNLAQNACNLMIFKSYDMMVIERLDSIFNALEGQGPSKIFFMIII